METVILTFMIGLMGAGIGIAIRTSIHGRYLTWVVCSLLAVAEIIAGLILTHTEPGSFGLVSTAISLAVSVGSVLVYRRNWQRRLTQLIVDSGQLTSFVQKRFADLDVDGDGNITRFDISNARQKRSFTAQEDVWLTQLDGYIWLIGHIVSSLRTVSPMSGSVVYMHTHGVNKEDISDWSLRALDEYERDFSF